MTSPGVALWLALRDLYAQSWRLALVNGALGLALVTTLLLAVANPLALVLVPLTGPLAAALVHCAVTVVRDGDLRLADAARGLRRHWRRGLVLGTGLVAVAALGAVAIGFYAGAPAAWPLAFVTLYALAALVLYALLVSTFAVAEPDAPLRAAARDAAAVVATRPGATLLIGLALLLVNAAGVAAALMPFLTLTLAFTFLAAARFVLPAESV